jgi:uncharacterized protein
MKKAIAWVFAGAIGSLFCILAQQTTQKFGVRVQPGPMDSVLLKDYAPESSLVVPQTNIAKARFPVVDVHTHSGQSSIRTSEDVAAWVKTMDEVGIETSVVFTGATGAEFDRQVELFKPYANRFQLWCSLEGGDITAPDWPEAPLASWNAAIGRVRVESEK